MKNLVSLVVLTVGLIAVSVVGTGCATYQKNDVVKRNHITKDACGNTVDLSTYEDHSKGWALVGSQSYNRKYWSQIPVGAENNVSITPMNSSGQTHYWTGSGSVGYSGGYAPTYNSVPTYYNGGSSYVRYPDQISYPPGAVYQQPGPSVYTRYGNQYSSPPGAVYPSYSTHGGGGHGGGRR
jgi:hypothetical protein